MAAGKSQDLFDDSVMTFGEHLEVLRVHLWRALIGVVIGTILCLYYGNAIIGVIRKPIDDALRKRNIPTQNVIDVQQGATWGDYFKRQFGLDGPSADEVKKSDERVEQVATTGTIQVRIKPSEIARILHIYDPKTYPEPTPVENEAEVPMTISSEEFQRLEVSIQRGEKPVTLTVQEAFLTYLKVSFIAGLVLTSPWVIYQMWLFVAAGLYPHERSYVYTYLPMSIGQFLMGIVFCFYVVFPFILKFMLGFNDDIDVTPQIRLSEWISFAVSLPVMFGISFQLPMVMLFLERISVFNVQSYRDKRRMAVFTIAIIAMLLTPPDPISMLSMMTPLILLYEFGILLCRFSPSARSPFEAEQAV
jgi:sec-independent protein translocase protein TatC